MDNRIANNFNKVYDVLIKKHKRTDIAKKMGFTTTTQLNNILSGAACISTPAIMNLVKNFKVNATFLFTGEGNMFSNIDSSVKYKVWVEIERIDIDPKTGEESYSDTDFPESIAYRDSFEDATELQQEIVKTFGEI